MSTAETAAARQSQLTADRIEFAATVLMAVAAILTAWAAFQSTKWNGIQSDNYSQAGAARTESTRATTIASRQITIDVNVFLEWLAAYQDDRAAGLIPEGPYRPDTSTLSGFIATRFRPEFLPAFEAWTASQSDPNTAPASTPFDLPEYALGELAESARLEAVADARTAEARQANQRGDNYVLLTVMFAIGLFFAGVSGKLERVTNSAIALGISAFIVVIAAVIMLTYPIEV